MGQMKDLAIRLDEIEDLWFDDRAEARARELWVPEELQKLKELREERAKDDIQFLIAELVKRLDGGLDAQ